MARSIPAAFRSTFFIYLSFFALIFHPAVFGGHVFVRRDILRFYYPMWKYSSESLKQGLLPLWNPGLNMGFPHLANVQTCVFYPPTALFLLPDYEWAFNFYIVLHLAMAGYFTFLWLRNLKASPAAALLAGFAFSLGGYMMSTVNLTISMCTAAWFPLVLLGFRKALERGFFWKALAGITLALQYLAGDPAVFFATALVLGFWTLCRTIRLSIETRTFVPAPGLAFLSVLAVFAGLAAVQWFLFAEFIVHSMRSRLSYDLATMWSMQYNDLVSIAVPFFSDLSMYVIDYWTRQSWLENYYCGITTLALAGAACALDPKDSNIRRHAALAAFGLTLAVGRFLPVYGALQAVVPFFGLIRYPIRFFFLFAFPIACLAGFGLDRLTERLRPAHLSPLFLTFTLAAAVAAVVVGFHSAWIEEKTFHFVARHFQKLVEPYYDAQGLRDYAAATLSNLGRSIGLLALALAVIAAGLRFRIARALVAAFFLTLVAADLGTANVIEPMVPSSVLRKPSSHMERIAGDPGLFRIMASPKTVRQQAMYGSRDFAGEIENQKKRLVTNLMLSHGFQDVFGYDSLFIREIYDIQTSLLTLRTADSPLIDWLNVKYLVSPEEKLPEKYQLLENSEPVNLFLNAGALPRAFLSERAIYAKNPGKLAGWLKSPRYDAQKRIFVEEPLPRAILSAQKLHRPKGASTVTVEEYSAQKIRMSVEVSDKPWLFLSDAYYPGWKAWVNGTQVRICRANHAFRALYLEPGRHEILWKYDPPLFKWGGAVTLVTALALAVYFGRARIFS